MVSIDRLTNLGLVRPFPSTGYAPVPSTTTSRRPDQVDISETGYALSTAVSDAPIRAAKIASVRSAIQSGDYDTDEKLDLAIDGLLRELSV